MANRQLIWLGLLRTRNIVIVSLFLECLLFYFYYFPESKILLGDEGRYFNTGLSIAAGGDWHNNPLWPPMQSLLISFFVRLFDQPLLPLQIFQYVMLLLAGFIVRDIVKRETQNYWAAQLSLALMLCYPTWLAYSQFLWPEVIHVTLFVSILWINNYKNHHYTWLAFSGGLLGLALLFKSLLVLFFPVLLMPLFTGVTKGGFNLLKAMTRSLVFIMVTIIVISPASFKAHKMTNGWMVSNSSMFNLWYGLKDDKRQHFTDDKGGKLYKQYIKSADNFVERNHLIKQQAIEKIRNDGLITTVVNQMIKQYFRLFDHQTFFTQQFQGAIEHNNKNKYHHDSQHGLVSAVRWFDHLFYFSMFVAMFFGLWISVRNSLLAKQMALFLLYTLGLFLFLHAKTRFRIPLMPVMAYFSAALWHHVSQDNFHWAVVLNNKKTLIRVTSVVAVVMFVVFAGGLLDKVLPI